jgi:hypothetical protein
MMTRRPFILLLALLAPLSARATLVVLVPSSDGLVVAADSRISFLGAECDGQFKIIEPSRPARTIAMVTGDSVFVAPPPAGERDLCRYLQSAPHLLDIGEVVRRYLEREASGAEEFPLKALGKECVAALERFAKANPAELHAYAGREIFSVIVAGYDPRRHTATLRNFVVRMDKVTLRIESARMTTTTVTASDRRGVWLYGESGYVETNVLAGFGRKYLDAATLDFILTAASVAGAPLNRAVATATNLINAASRTTETLPAPSGIGGPVNIVLLGRDPRPRPVSPAAP